MSPTVAGGTVRPKDKPRDVPVRKNSITGRSRRQSSGKILFEVGMIQNISVNFYIQLLWATLMKTCQHHRYIGKEMIKLSDRISPPPPLSETYLTTVFIDCVRCRPCCRCVASGWASDMPLYGFRRIGIECRFVDSPGLEGENVVWDERRPAQF